MIETIMTMCSLYMGQQAIDCRLHIRHCVEMKGYSEISNRRKVAQQCRERIYNRYKVCETMVASPSFCKDVREELNSCSWREDNYNEDDYRDAWIEVCAKKEGVI